MKDWRLRRGWKRKRWFVEYGQGGWWTGGLARETRLEVLKRLWRNVWR